jgi:hypothetical protein
MQKASTRRLRPAQSSSIGFLVWLLDHLELSVSHISDVHPSVSKTKIAAFDGDYQQPAISKDISIVTADLQVVNWIIAFGYQQVIHIPLSIQTRRGVFTCGIVIPSQYILSDRPINDSVTQKPAFSKRGGLLIYIGICSTPPWNHYSKTSLL